MQSKNKKHIVNEPEVIYRNNKPVSVIIDIDKYNEIIYTVYFDTAYFEICHKSDAARILIIRYFLLKTNRYICLLMCNK